MVFDAPFADRTQWAAGASSAYPPGGVSSGDNKLDRLVPGYGPDGDLFTAVRESAYRWRTPLVTTENTQGGFELLPGDLLEAQCLLTAAQGGWPALWTWGRDLAGGRPQPGHGEVDVFEYHDDHPRLLELSNHVRPGDPAYIDDLVTPGQWFTVGCRFDPDSVRWSVDGQQVHADGRGVGADWRAWIIVNLSVAAGQWGHRRPRPETRRLSWRCRELRVYRAR
ncbi:beta-glucanase [Streptomyces tateyamensis]|uniref:Beta-glucanase n=1 Tax=Streptomyces tateyamensis TaxID=565073 RepID=A0A2V4NUB3_9ACTN|nr:beta-glucanase [Streptomyces tateyamensis]